MNRRQFLRYGVLVTTSVATAGLAGCGGGGGDGSPAPTPIPQYFPGTTIPIPPTPAASGGNYKYPQSIASGDPRPDSVTLWARVVPSGADDVNTSASDANFSIRVRLTSENNAGALGSNNALSGNLVVDAEVPVYAFYDNTLRHRIFGLQPGTTYYYQFIAGDVRSKVGRFKTAPAADANNERVKFAFVTCQDWQVNHWAAYSALAAEDLDFVVHLGDYIYETVGDHFQQGGVEPTHTALTLPNGVARPGSSTAKYANTLADYRYLYKKYRTDPRLQAAHERFAFISIWDDHEFSDDCWKDAETYTHGVFDRATGGGDNAHQPTRRRDANRAWFEYQPADISLVLDPLSGINNVSIYRDLQFGQLMHLILTDQRLYRSDHLIPEAAPNPATGQPLGTIGARYMVPEKTLAEVEAAKMAAFASTGDPLGLVSMLGRDQRTWWKAKMRDSKATWKVWANEVSLLKMGADISQLAAAPAAFKTKFILNADMWDGYNAERKDLMAWLKTNNVNNVVAITGDIHAFFAGEVHDDYATAGSTGAIPRMVDLVTAGVSSNSYYSYFAGAVADPAYQPVTPLVFTSEAASEAIAIQMLSALIATQAGVTDLSNTQAVQQAVAAAIAAGKIPPQAVQPTPSLAKTPINTFNDTIAGNMGATVGGSIAALAAGQKSAAAMTLYGAIQAALAAGMGIPASAVPAAEIVKRLNPFANFTTGTPPPVNNPWIKYADTDAQGFAVVTVTKTQLQCEFRKLNRLVNGQPPATPVAGVKTATVLRDTARVTVA